MLAGICLLGGLCLKMAAALFVLKVMDDFAQSFGMFCPLWH